MEFPKVICVTRDRRFARQTHQAIGLSCDRITVVADPADLSDRNVSRADLVLLDAQFLEEEPRLVLGAEPVFESVRDGALVLLNPTQLESCVELLSMPQCDHIICGDPLSSNSELLTMIRKTASSDIFGLRKYIPWGGYCYESNVSSFIDKRNVVSWVGATAHRVGTARWLTTELEIMTDELLSNAIYSEGLSDDERFMIGPVSSGILSWACSDGCIHVSVTDQRGTFAKEMLSDALRDLAVETGDELTLLGLPRHITLAQRLIVNVIPGFCTEIILSVPLRSRKSAVPSIGYFATDQIADEASTDTSPKTININGRLVIETIGLEAPVSIHEINALAAEVTLSEPIAQQIYPGSNFTLAVNVPFHGEFKVSGLVFRVLGDDLPTLSLSFATGYQEWERVVKSIVGGGR
jgi:hypothetical protein